MNKTLILLKLDFHPITELVTQFYETTLNIFLLNHYHHQPKDVHC